MKNMKNIKTRYKVAIVVGTTAAMVFAAWTHEDPLVVENTPEVVVDERDNIQKLADNVATTWRDLQDAEATHSKDLERASTSGQIAVEKLQKYNDAVEYLNTYTK
jgi:hypothetical protein